jgi:photosystem II stability/assembly factor-like uncharacterized protein
MKSTWLKLLAMLMFASVYALGVGRQWAVLGPDGGDVRSLAYDPQDPNRVFLGTSTGVIFVSEDGGHNWLRFAKLGSGDDYVLDHIAIDPQTSKTMFVSAWSVQDQSAGDIFRTHDGGKDWEALPAMHGKSVRAMAIAASDPKTVVAGALDGVYRSRDGGKNWEHISDAGVKNIGVENRRRRRQLAAHQQRHDRRLRRILHHCEFGGFFGSLCQRLFGHLQEHQRR